MRLTFHPKNIVLKFFLYSMALQPIVALLWQQKIAFFKLNWLLYPFIFAGVVFSIWLRKKAPAAMFALLVTMILYGIIFLGRPTDWESIFRIFVNLLPLTFLAVLLREDDGSAFPTLWKLYFFAMLFPIAVSYLQLKGIIPYYEFDAIEGELAGRISGGYNKPNNFVAFLFPLFLFGFFRWMVQGRRLQGLGLIALVLFIVYLTGLRTAVAIFFLIFVGSFFKEVFGQVVYYYYKFYLNFVVGVLCFVGLYVFFQNYGLVDGLRGRIPMWLAHADTFFESSVAEVLTGRGYVFLPKEYGLEYLIGTLDEVHNNTFRTIITFGLVGYFLYCVLIRWLVLLVVKYTPDPTMRFIKLSCFVFLLLYSITNEPAYYSSIIWSVLLGIFPAWKASGQPAWAKAIPE